MQPFGQHASVCALTQERSRGREPETSRIQRSREREDLLSNDCKKQKRLQTIGAGPPTAMLPNQAIPCHWRQCDHYIQQHPQNIFPEQEVTSKQTPRSQHTSTREQAPQTRRQSPQRPQRRRRAKRQRSATEPRGVQRHDVASAQAPVTTSRAAPRSRREAKIPCTPSPAISRGTAATSRRAETYYPRRCLRARTAKPGRQSSP